jgi:holo-[acyl-carrier protein] synthase
MVMASLGVRGLGTDLVEVERFRLAVRRRATLPQRLFTDGERAYADGQRDPVKSLAARFGAKEAVMKALGAGLGAFPFRDVEVVRDGSGAPSLALHGAAAALAAERGVQAWQVSLTHTDVTAMAVVLALG